MKVTLETFRPNRPLGFVVIEGVNGAGKTTLQKGLQDRFENASIPTVLSHEPGGTAFGTEIRRLLLGNSAQARSPLCEAFLFSADRAEHVDKVIRPALEEKKLVILDRYYYSTIAFQGYGRGLSLKPLLQMSEVAIGGIRPDLVIVLDLDPAEGLKRNSEKTEEDSFESEEIDFHRKLRQGFLKLADSLAEPFVVLDAKRPKEELLAESIAFVERVTPR